MARPDDDTDPRAGVKAGLLGERGRKPGYKGHTSQRKFDGPPTLSTGGSPFGDANVVLVANTPGNVPLLFIDNLITSIGSQHAAPASRKKEKRFGVVR